MKERKEIACAHAHMCVCVCVCVLSQKEREGIVSHNYHPGLGQGEQCSSSKGTAPHKGTGSSLFRSHLGQCVCSLSLSLSLTPSLFLSRKGHEKCPRPRWKVALTVVLALISLPHSATPQSPKPSSGTASGLVTLLFPVQIQMLGKNLI